MKNEMTDKEITILECLDKKYKYIARDENDRLFVFETKPIKLDKYWKNENKYIELPYEKMFEFITWWDAKPYLIEGLLKGEYSLTHNLVNLTEDEKTILKNIVPFYQWIVRDLSGNLCLFHSKPIHGLNAWINGVIRHEFYCFNHLFSFIRWSDIEPYNIVDLIREG